MPLSLLNLAGGSLAVTLFASLGFAGWQSSASPGLDGLSPAETISIAAGTLAFPLTGEFQSPGRTISPPVEPVAFDRPVEVMRYQVSRAEYQSCVAAGACKAAANDSSSSQALPVTGVNYFDAQAYASWYSQATGEAWRLPTAAEWAYFAGERFTTKIDDKTNDPDNPAAAWIRQYQRDAAISRTSDPMPHQRGFYGANAYGVEDLAGNVWEWTSDCFVRTTLSSDGSRTVHKTVNCGVHIAEGRHRAYMSDFISDPKSGGCALGAPPDNLGFRLVRERHPTYIVRLRNLLHGLADHLPA